MGETVLFSLAGRFLSFLAPHALNQMSLPWYAKKELKKLEKKITTIRNVLLDAQEQQNSKPAVKEWLRRLKRILQEADDLFDELATEALRRDLATSKSTSFQEMWRKVRNFFTSSNPVIHDYNLGCKIKYIRESLDDVCTDMRDFGFVVQTLERPIIKTNEGTTSFVDTRKIIGRDNDKKTLLRLLSSSPDDENVHVIPVVGMGGLGKTTLAQMIFNDNSVKTEFDKKVWVCVSDDFSVERILTEILTAVGENARNVRMEQLQNCFRTKFSGKKFFFVLDDVWNDDLVEWKKLEELLMTGARGSRVLVTTRDKKVAKIVHTMKPYVLKGLTEKECLSILVNWAFEKGEETKHPYLIEIGREIVKKCGGVPLAARTLGVLLYSKTNQREWLLVKNSEIWTQVQNQNSIIPILKLSYDQMPSSLKECFGYCSLFKKDEEISKERLIYHWIAHGFIQSSDNNVDLEDVCETYLEELLRRSFLEYPSGAYIHVWNPVKYKMHDLVHDLAQYVVGGESVIVQGEEVSAASHRVRHLSLDGSSKVPESLLKDRNLRTIMRRLGPEHFTGSFVETILSCRKLRVLDEATYARFCDLHENIGKFVYLRHLYYPRVNTIPNLLCKLLNLQFLDLSDSQFDKLPDDFGNLRKLRVLNLESSELICIPEGIRNFASLRKLIIRCSKLRSLPMGLGCLTCLQHLEIFGCNKLEFSNKDFQGLASLKYLLLSCLDELKELPMGLQDTAASLKHLTLDSCSNLRLTEEVLPNLHSLEVLEITYCGSITCLPEEIRNLTSLHKLIISCDKLRSLPMGLGCLTSLQHLEILGCNKLEFSNNDFQGLASLKYLLLSYHELKKLPMGLQDTAATLKHLRLKRCDNLRLTEEVLPNLHSLEVLKIGDCRNITCLPEGMQRLDKLTNLEINLTEGLGERCKPTGEDWPKIAHVPNVYVDGRDVRFIQRTRKIDVRQNRFFS